MWRKTIKSIIYNRRVCCNKFKYATLFIDANDLDLIPNFELKDGWFDINKYHYVAKDAYLFKDNSFNNPIILQEMYQKVFVIKSDGEWSYIVTDSGEYGYMESFLLYKLPDFFVDIDISDQMTRLYQNSEMIYSTYDVTGKDITPTDLGYFDIDGKVRDTHLKSTRPDGTYEYNVPVSYWMPYNGGEGLHDASWQNGYFGNTNHYHNGGSHGCVNLPLDAAQIIFDYVDIGTRVLVHK